MLKWGLPYIRIWITLYNGKTFQNHICNDLHVGTSIQFRSYETCYSWSLWYLPLHSLYRRFNF